MPSPIASRCSLRSVFASLIGLAIFAPITAGQIINEDFKIVPANGGLGNAFGVSVAIQGGLVAIGAGSASRAYVYNASTGALVADIVPDDFPTGSFGYAVDIDGGVIAVGAQWDNVNGGNSGSAYLFDAVSGNQLHKLIPSDGGIEQWFGNAIAIDGGIVAVGAHRDDDNGTRSGSVYLFDAFTGAELLKITPADGASFDEFGYSVALDDGILAVGAWSDGDQAPAAGAAYLFNVADGSLITKIYSGHPNITDYFGISVAVGDGMAVVGSYRHNHPNNDSGGAFMYEASTGAYLGELTQNDPASTDYFGRSVAVSNGLVVVGADRDDDGGTDTGSAYLFDAATGTQIAKLRPTDGSTGAYFGISVAIENSRIFAGANVSFVGNRAGSAYAFTAPAPECAVDFTGEGTVDFFDLLAFLTAFTNQEAAADWNNDSVFDFFDIQLYLAAFAAGCP